VGLPCCSQYRGIVRVAGEARAYGAGELGGLGHRPGHAATDADIDESRALERLSEFLRQLNPVERQVIVCYLEGLGGDAISEVTGVSPANVAMKVSRVKQALGRRFGKEFGRGN
jgi:RNA polymerase sigma-70 factor (ECF subfamily)